jgi:hypothetical protein
MAHWSPPLGQPGGSLPGHTWARWSSLVRLAVWGGAPKCAACGSREVHGSRAERPGWTRALGLTPCRCDRCGEVFDVPRRAAPSEMEAEPEPEPILEWEPPAPKMDLSALDRDMEQRLRRDSSSEPAPSEPTPSE